MNNQFKYEEEKVDRTGSMHVRPQGSMNIESTPKTPRSPKRSFFNPARQTKVRLFYSTYIVGIVILILGFLYSLFHTSPDKLKVASVFASVSKTMNDAPISDIFVTVNECPHDFEMITLGHWPGTVHGCYYPSEHKIVKGQCAEHTTDGVGVNAMPARPLYKWRGKKFCIKRFEDYEINVTSPCREGYKKCAGYLCIPEDQRCPITSIKIYAEEPTTTEEEYAGESEGTKSVSIQRRDGDEPIIDFHLSVDGYPCLDLSSIPYRPNSYPLLNIPPVGCGYGENNEAKLIDSRPLVKVLKDSPVYNLTESLPMYYDSIQNNTAYFTGIPRFKVKREPECMKTKRFMEMASVSEDMISVGKIVNLFFIFGLFGTFSLSFFALEARSQLRSGVEAMDISAKGREGKILFAGCVLLSLFCLGCFIASYDKVQSVFRFSDKISRFTAQDCFMNKNITIALNDFAEALPSEVTIYSWIMIIMIILSLIPIWVILSEKYHESQGDTIILLRSMD